MAAMASQLAVDGEPRARGGAPAANPKFLLELIIADLHWSALQIASLALLTAAAAATGSTAELHACRHLVYDDTRVMRLALRYSSEAGLPDDLGRKLDQLYIAIGEALTPMGPFVQPIALTRAMREQLPRVLPVLRKTAQHSAECLTALEGVTRAALSSDYGEDSLVIRQFLGRAVRGDLVDLDRGGVLVAPRLMQRRHSPRIKTSRPCKLITGTDEFPAELVDVSREGLGVVCKCSLALGDKVSVLIGSRMLEATIKRLSGPQLGLILTKALPMGDPLFTGG